MRRSTMRYPKKRRASIALGLATLLALAACSSEEPEATSTPTPTASPTASPTTDPSTPCPAGDTRIVADNGGVEVSGSYGKEPTITVPAAAPDCRFHVIDLVEGNGATAGEGDTVTAHYKGMSWTYRAAFDSSFDGEAPSFPLGQVVKGWQRGIPGMKVGGRRLLVIPPFLGYGPQSPGPEIAINDTLVFVIDLQKVG